MSNSTNFTYEKIIFIITFCANLRYQKCQSHFFLFWPGVHGFNLLIKSIHAYMSSCKTIVILVQYLYIFICKTENFIIFGDSQFYLYLQMRLQASIKSVSLNLDVER